MALLHKHNASYPNTQHLKTVLPENASHYLALSVYFFHKDTTQAEGGGEEKMTVCTFMHRTLPSSY
jgi:hypothetical protein